MPRKRTQRVMDMRLGPMNGRDQSQGFQRFSEYRDTMPIGKCRRFGSAEHEQFKRGLPIYTARTQILQCIRDNPTVILIGETGSGKTTQLPQYIYEEFLMDREDDKGIAITQPRRLAAKSIAYRVSDELECQVGDLVGYHVRFEHKTGPKTLITFLTDGMLLREIMLDPELTAYRYIILDEAHERTLNTEVACALIRQLQLKRPDLKVVIMSATLDDKLFRTYFGEPPVLYVQGRQYPVQIYYTAAPLPNLNEGLITTIFQIHLDEPAEDADILAFLSGYDSIESTARVLRKRSRLLPPNSPKLIVCTLYSMQSLEKQEMVFKKTPKDCRKVVLATNIAESSITVPGIKYVVDTGLVKQKKMIEKSYLQQLQKKNTQNAIDQNNGNNKNFGGSGCFINLLQVVPESRAQSWQRAGRAGRTQSGKVFRLFTESYFLNEMPPVQPAEIRRVDLTSLILQLLSIGIRDPVNFPYMEPPNKKLLCNAMMNLVRIGAVDRTEKITQLGRKMVIFPLEPKYSVALVKSRKFDCTNEILDVLAMLTTENIFYLNEEENGQKGQSPFSDLSDDDEMLSKGDHALLLLLYYSYLMETETNRKNWARAHSINWRSMQKALDIRKQLSDYWKMTKWNLPEEDFPKIKRLLQSKSEWTLVCQNVGKCLLTGFFENVALRLPNGTYESLRDGTKMYIHPSSVMFNSKAQCILCDQIVFTTKCYMKTVTPIERIWLDEVVPEYTLNLKSQRPPNPSTGQES